MNNGVELSPTIELIPHLAPLIEDFLTSYTEQREKRHQELFENYEQQVEVLSLHIPSYLPSQFKRIRLHYQFLMRYDRQYGKKRRYLRELADQEKQKKRKRKKQLLVFLLFYSPSW